MSVQCTVGGASASRKFLLDNGRLQLDPVKQAFGLLTVELIIGEVEQSHPGQGALLVETLFVVGIGLSNCCWLVKFLLDNGRLQLDPVRQAFGLLTVKLILGEVEQFHPGQGALLVVTWFIADTGLANVFPVMLWATIDTDLAGII